ncbi:MAG TPA: Gfo/Idh/MocA family oxidoreductase [Armatimonadota bacterium]|nr:Gfo/Idh/MocA family oxidoreductase [Armatimonadota bacterium]
MPAKMRVGFVGAGGMARAHAEALSKLRDVSVAAFCDADPVRTGAVAEHYRAPIFKSAREMLERVELDAAYVCLPPFAHGAEFELIERGLPFFVEKPINLDLAQAREIAAGAEAKHLITCAGYMNRYRRGVLTVRRLLERDPPVLVTGGWIGGVPRPRPDIGIWTWWVQKRKSGGQFLEQVTHTVDLARFLCGDAVEVHAYGATGFNTGTPDTYDIEDASVVNIKFAGGAIANLWASCSSNAAGGVSLNVYANDVAAQFTGWEHTVRVMRVGKDTVEIKGEGDIFAAEDMAFIKAVRGGNPAGIMSPYGDAVKTLAVTVAANRSLKRGKPVAVD